MPQVKHLQFILVKSYQIYYIRIFMDHLHKQPVAWRFAKNFIMSCWDLVFTAENALADRGLLGRLHNCLI